jgi:4-amino-4-deoxy-L-arabinose transferase-like glycosyltransferase
VTYGSPVSATATLATAPQPSTASPGRRLPVWPVLAAGAALRLWYLTTPQAQLDGDEAMTGLMVRRILGGHLYAFLADQRYNGAVEQYLQAAVWAVLPQTPFTLRLPQVGLAVLACWLVYRVGQDMFGTRRAWLAAALFAVGPFFEIWKGIRSHGPYLTAQLLGLLGIVLALRLREDAPRARWLAAGFGLVVGLGAWLSWSAAYLLVPAACWLAAVLRRRLSLALPLAGGAVLGYAPALLWALRYGQLPLLGGPQPERTPLERLRLLAGPVLREFLGVGYFDARPGWPRPLQAAAVLALTAAYGLACWRRRRGLLDIALLRDRWRAPSDLLLLVPPVVAVLYAVSKYAWWSGEPRYLFAAYPALALGLAALAPRTGRRWVATGVSGALLIAVGGTSIGTALRHAGDADASRDTCLQQAADWLADNGVTAAYSDYWTGTPLQLLTGDRLGLRIGPMWGGRNKFPELRHAADAAPPAYVLSHVRAPMGLDEDQVMAMDRALREHGVTATRTQVGCVTVYTNLRPPMRPVELGRGLPMPDRPQAPGARRQAPGARPAPIRPSDAGPTGDRPLSSAWPEPAGAPGRFGTGLPRTPRR